MGKSTIQGYVCAAAAVIIWSGFILVSRQGGISPLLHYDVIAIRYLVCATVLLPFWWFKFRFNLFEPRLIVLSMVGGLAYALFAFSGFASAPASHAAVLLPGVMPLFILLLSAWLNNERPQTHQWLGVGLISAGVAGLLWHNLSDPQALSKGHLYLVAAALCWSVFSVLVKRWQISAWQGTIGVALITSIVYLPVYLFWLPRNLVLGSLQALSGEIALQAVYQGVLATIVQMLLYLRAVQTIGPSNMGAMMALVPIIAGLSATAIFGEILTSELALGLVFVSAGAFVASSNFLNKRRKLQCLLSTSR